MEERNYMLDELKFQLERAQNRMKVYADKKRRDVEYAIANMVYMKLKPYRLKHSSQSRAIAVRSW